MNINELPHRFDWADKQAHPAFAYLRLLMTLIRNARFTSTDVASSYADIVPLLAVGLAFWKKERLSQPLVTAVILDGVRLTHQNGAAIDLDAEVIKEMARALDQNEKYYSGGTATYVLQLAVEADEQFFDGLLHVVRGEVNNEDDQDALKMVLNAADTASWPITSEAMRDACVRQIAEWIRAARPVH